MTKQAIQDLIQTYRSMNKTEAITLKRNFTRSVATCDDKAFFTFCSLTPFVCADIENPNTEIFFQTACMMAFYLSNNNAEENEHEQNATNMQTMLRQVYQTAKAEQNEALIKRIELFLTGDGPEYTRFYSSLRSLIKMVSLETQMKYCDWEALLRDLLYWDGDTSCRAKWTRMIVARSYTENTNENNNHSEERK